MFRDRLAEGAGLVLEPCSSVHTFGMRFPIDIVFVDREGHVIGLVSALPPWRPWAGAWRARRTIELPIGAIEVSHTQLGDVLAFTNES